MRNETTATTTYHLWTNRNAPAIVVGDRVRFEGSVRGYLTKPSILFSSTGDPSFRLGGNRRIAPSRHILESPGAEMLAVFKTKRVQSPIDTRATSILDSDGSEIATLVLEGDSLWNRLRAAFRDDYLLKTNGQLVGSLGRCSATPKLRTSRRGGAADS